MAQPPSTCIQAIKKQHGYTIMRVHEVATRKVKHASRKAFTETE